MPTVCRDESLRRETHLWSVRRAKSLRRAEDVHATEPLCGAESLRATKSM